MTNLNIKKPEFNCTNIRQCHNNITPTSHSKHAVQNSGKFEIRRRLRQKLSKKRRAYLPSSSYNVKTTNRPGKLIHNKEIKRIRI